MKSRNFIGVVGLIILSPVIFFIHEADQTKRLRIIKILNGADQTN